MVWQCVQPELEMSCRPWLRNGVPVWFSKWHCPQPASMYLAGSSGCSHCSVALCASSTVVAAPCPRWQVVQPNSVNLCGITGCSRNATELTSARLDSFRPRWQVVQRSVTCCSGIHICWIPPWKCRSRVASGIQAASVDVFSPLDRNGLYHLLSMVGVAFLYLGGMQFRTT